MTLFEYIAVAASLVCSFVVVRLLGGIAAAFQPESRYWVHAIWVCLGIFLISLNWWLFWSYQEVDWNYTRFLIALLPLGILYVTASVVIPAEASQVRSWRDHYFTIRRRFMALNIAYVAAIVLATVVLLGSPVWHPGRVLLAIAIAMFTAGLFSESPRLHAAIVLWFTAHNLLAAVIFQSPGSFGTPPW